MRTRAPLALSARAADEPGPDLTSMLVTHRAMRQDLRRLAVCLGHLTRGDVPPSRVPAVARYATALLAAIRAYHRGEDDILWPVIAAAAGQAVDLTPLADDHEAIDAALGRADRALASAVADPGQLAELYARVRELRDMLDEHIADKQAQLIPAMRLYLSAGAYRWCERQVRRQGSAAAARFTAAWLARHARPAELPRLLAASGWRARILLTAARPGYARLEREAFGIMAVRGGRIARASR